MTNMIGNILSRFRGCFSREASFGWFTIIIVGFVVRLDHHGVTSVIRWLGPDPAIYTSLLGFFRASSWKIGDILRCWQGIVWSCRPLITVDGRFLLCGDGIKIAKEAQKMPGVKKLHQESDNSGKAAYIYGHHYGVIGVLAGWVKKNLLCAPSCRVA